MIGRPSTGGVQIGEPSERELRPIHSDAEQRLAKAIVVTQGRRQRVICQTTARGLFHHRQGQPIALPVHLQPQFSEHLLAQFCKAKAATMPWIWQIDCDICQNSRRPMAQYKHALS